MASYSGVNGTRHRSQFGGSLNPPSGLLYYDTFPLPTEPVAGINITTDKEGEDFPLGESLMFTCSVQRGTSISFYWKHNETTVQQNSERYQLQDNRKVLYIPSLQYHHTGTYQCNAKNQLSVNGTLSEVRHVNILELSQDGRTPYPSHLYFFSHSCCQSVTLGKD